MITETLMISSRFCGPPQSGNGGYVSGRLAKHLPGPAVVRLRAPPPLDIALQIEASEDEARLIQGSTLIAEAHRCELEIEVPAAPSFDEAEDASRAYTGFIHHSFPTCFVCGPKRIAGDGMRIFPGLIRGSRVLAAPWTPDASLADASGLVLTEFMWAALDCAGAFAVISAGLAEGNSILLGEIRARLNGTVAPGEPCVVIAWPEGADGRKHFACTAILSPSGNTVAVARATWIEIPAAAVTS